MCQASAWAAWETWDITRGSWEGLGEGGVCWRPPRPRGGRGFSGSSVSFLAPTSHQGPPKLCSQGKSLKAAGRGGLVDTPCQGQSRRLLNQHQDQPLSKGCQGPWPILPTSLLAPPGQRLMATGPTGALQAGRDSSTPSPVSAPPPQHLSVPGPDPGPSGGQTEVSRPTQFSRSHFKTLASPG